MNLIEPMNSQIDSMPIRFQATTLMSCQMRITIVNVVLINTKLHMTIDIGKTQKSPQGTVLGPVLFLILMSDITEEINCNIVFFADDSRLYSAINRVTDCDDLQADLKKIYK